jgi:hypothetical protein
MYAIVKDQSHLIGKVIGLLKIDSDWLFYQALYALVLLWMVWPLAFSWLSSDRLWPAYPHRTIDAD